MSVLAGTSVYLFHGAGGPFLVVAPDALDSALTTQPAATALTLKFADEPITWAASSFVHNLPGGDNTIAAGDWAVDDELARAWPILSWAAGTLTLNEAYAGSTHAGGVHIFTATGSVQNARGIHG